MTHLSGESEHVLSGAHEPPPDMECQACKPSRPGRVDHPVSDQRSFRSRRGECDASNQRRGTLLPGHGVRLAVQSDGVSDRPAENEFELVRVARIPRGPVGTVTTVTALTPGGPVGPVLGATPVPERPIVPSVGSLSLRSIVACRGPAALGVKRAVIVQLASGRASCRRTRHR